MKQYIFNRVRTVTYQVTVQLPDNEASLARAEAVAGIGLVSRLRDKEHVTYVANIDEAPEELVLVSEQYGELDSSLNFHAKHQQNSTD